MLEYNKEFGTANYEGFASPSIEKDNRIAPVTTMRWTTERYHQATELGILGKYDRVELIDGDIWRKVDRTPYGCAMERRLSEFFRNRFSAESYRMDGIGQLSLPPYTSAEPDFKVYDRFQTYAWPTAKDTHLVVEVMEENTLKRDRIKAEVYATNGIKEYWIINLVDNQIEVHLNPNTETNTFADVNQYKQNQEFDSPFAGNIKVSDLLPATE